RGLRNDTQIPAFCYRITVRNCGLAQLTNVLVMDDQLPGISTNFPSILNSGQVETRFFKMAWGADTTNTVTVTGQSAGQTVTARDSAVALVDRARITCDARVTAPCDLDGQTNDNHVTLPATGGPCAVTFVVTVCNTGRIDLTNVVADCPNL